MHMIFIRRALAAAAMSGAAFATITGASERASAGGGDLRCTIETRKSGDMVELSALVSAPQKLTGSYRLRVSKDGGGGSADIDQSGEFAVSNGGETVVSHVTLGGDGHYTARLSVTANDRTIDCAKKTGGSIRL